MFLYTVGFSIAIPSMLQDMFFETISESGLMRSLSLNENERDKPKINVCYTARLEIV